MSLATIIKDIQNRLKGVEDIKDIIFDEVEETIDKFKGEFGDIGKYIKDELMEDIDDFKAKIMGEFEESKKELLSHIEDLIGIKDELLKEVEDLKGQFEFDIEEVVVAETKDITAVLLKLKEDNPETFQSRGFVTKYMTQFLKENDFGHDWYTFWKTLRKA